MTLNILIVDDDTDVSGFIARRIAKESPKFTISVVESGMECLEYLKSNHIDCILSDYQMPGMNGMELLHALRVQGIATPFIFITGQGNEEVAREAFKNGAYDYFTKESGFAHFARINNSIEQAVKAQLAEINHKKADSALFEEKNKLDSILSSINDAISIQDTEFRVLYQNPAHIGLLGNHVGELCHEGYNNQDQVCKDCQLVPCFEEGRPHTVVKSRNIGGKEVYYEIKTSPLRDSSGRIIAGIESVRDITERKLIEHSHRDAKLLYSTLFENSPDGILIVDSNGKFIEFNSAAHTQLGYTREEFADLSISDVDPVESPEEIRDRMAEIFDKGIAEFEVKHRTKSGEIRDVYIINQAIDLSGQTFVHTIWRDITERRKVDDELRNSEARLSEAELIAEFGSWEWRIDRNEVHWSDGLCNIFGIEPDEFGKTYNSFLDFVHPEDKDRVMRVIADSITDAAPLRYEARIIKKDGSECTIYVFGKLSFGEDGKPAKLFGTVQDITGLKLLERQKADFYAMVTHDLKSPLTSIMGYAELLATDERAREQTTEIAVALFRSSNKLGRIIEDFLIHSRLELGTIRPNMAKADVSQLIREVRDEFVGQASQKGLTLTAETENGLPHLTLDKPHITRALANLMQNAVNYSPDGACITLRATRGAGIGGDFVIFSVSDTGPGINPEDREKVFDKYYRSPNTAHLKGTGLGLSIVKAVAEAHGGRVELESEVGKGSTFKLILPMNQ